MSVVLLDHSFALSPAFSCPKLHETWYNGDIRK